MAYGPPTVVNEISRLPFPFGLFSVVAMREDSEGRWQNGIEWEAPTCAVAGGIGDPDCETEEVTGLPREFEGTGVLGEATPFTVYGSHVCGPVGHPVSYIQERARLHLAAREQARVERALWTGDLGNTPNLQDSATKIGTTAVSAVEGIAILEDAIAREYGSLGVIHMTRGVATILAGANVLVASGSTLKTILGTPVVAGAGYPGTSKSGAAAGAGKGWIYGSSAVMGYRSEVFTASNREGDLLDRRTNDLYAVAERNYVLGFDDCGISAVLINTANVTAT